MTTAYSGDEVLATGWMGRITPNGHHVIIHAAVEVRVPRDGVRLVRRRTSAWWNGLAVEVVESPDGALSVFGTRADDDPPLPAEAMGERGRFQAHDIDGASLSELRVVTDELSFDRKFVDSAIGLVSAAKRLRGLDPVPLTFEQPLVAGMVDAAGNRVDPGSDLRWQFRLGEFREAIAEQLNVSEELALTTVLDDDHLDGAAVADTGVWIGDEVQLGWYRTREFLPIADVTRRWEALPAPSAILAGTYLRTEDGWYRGESDADDTHLLSQPLSSLSPSFVLANGTARRRIRRDEVQESTQIRTTAEVEGRRVVIDAPWSALIQQSVEVRAEDPEPGTVFAGDGHPIRFRKREQGVTAFVRPSDLHNLTSEVVASSE